MSFGEAIKSCFNKYATFSGRARRSEFWYFALFLFLLDIIPVWIVFPYYVGIIGLAMLIPSLAVSVRRLHDTGRSGVYLLFALIPLVGAILLIIWACEDSQPGANEYGPNPKGLGGQQYQAQPSYGVRAESGSGAYGVSCIIGPMQGQRFAIGPMGLTFGRDPNCSVSFPANATGVSRMHCRLYTENGLFMLIDLGSSYGTYLSNGLRLPQNTPFTVELGTRFYLGNQSNTFEITPV